MEFLKAFDNLKQNLVQLLMLSMLREVIMKVHFVPLCDKLCTFFTKTCSAEGNNVVEFKKFSFIQDLIFVIELLPKHEIRGKMFVLVLLDN